MLIRCRPGKMVPNYVIEVAHGGTKKAAFARPKRNRSLLARWRRISIRLKEVGLLRGKNWAAEDRKHRRMRFSGQSSEALPVSSSAKQHIFVDLCRAGLERWAGQQAREREGATLVTVQGMARAELQTKVRQKNDLQQSEMMVPIK